MAAQQTRASASIVLSEQSQNIPVAPPERFIVRDQLLINCSGWETKIFGTRPNWVVSYIAYTKFHSPRPVFYSPGQIFTHIGERASVSFPACCCETHFSQTTPFLRSHLNVVETTIPGDEGCDLLAVLDQLYTDTLTDGRVRLLSLNTAVNKRNALMSHQDLSAGFSVLFDPLYQPIC